MSDTEQATSKRNPIPYATFAITFILSALAIWTISNAHAQEAEKKEAAKETATYSEAKVRIRDIQGASHTSPLNGKKVSNVPGVVTAFDSVKFYMQDEFPDDDNATSEAVVVYFGRDGLKDVPNVGDRVLVSGVVKEWNVSGMTLTEIAKQGKDKVEVEVLASNVDLPPAIRIGADGRMPPTQNIDDDNMKTFDADKDGIDFWESLEAMRIEVIDAVVVGATKHGGFAVLGDNGKDCGTRTARAGIVIDGETNDFNPERILVTPTFISELPTVTVGDTLAKIEGVVEYDYGSYQLCATAVPTLNKREKELEREVTELVATDTQLTIASFNIENFSKADGDERATEIAEVIVNNLKSPDIVGLQEVLDNDGTQQSMVVSGEATLDALCIAIRKLDGPRYKYMEIAPSDDKEGGVPGGNIRVAYLYNPDRVGFEASDDKGDATTNTEVVKRNGMAQLKHNPGRFDTENQCWDRTRRPLAAQFTFGDANIIVINCHLSSKRGDEGLFGMNQPPLLKSAEARTKQGESVNKFVKSIFKAQKDCTVIVLGDMNEYYFGEPMLKLAGKELRNLWEELDLNERYSYIYQGNSQTLDHIFVGGPLKDAEDKCEFDAVHVNSEYPEDNRASDHDPVIARLTLKEAVAAD